MQVLPGRERFYVRLEEPIDYNAWLDGVRRGRTFVTNGPAIDFRVDQHLVGDELMLKRPGSVMIEARVQFDPARDDVRQLEIIENGAVVQRFERKEGASEIRSRFEHFINQAAWLAARASGTKLGEREHPRYKRISPSLVHSAPIYVAVQGLQGLAEHPRAKVIAAAWLEALDDLDQRLASDQRLPEFAGRLSSNQGVDLDYLRSHRNELRERIASVRKVYVKLAH